MIGATLYLSCRDGKTNETREDTMPCSMCKRLIINAGIVKIICRTGEDEHITINTRDWVYNDDSLINIP
jgi:dCMP deaminase